MSAFFAGHARNDLQAVVEARYPDVKVTAWLSQHGTAMMTGSGACVFASYDSREEERVAMMAPETLGASLQGINKHSGMVQY